MTIETTRQLKQLDSQKKILIAERNGRKKQICVLQNKQNRDTLAIKEITGKIASLKEKKKTIVSEHAILRFIERAMGIDIEQIEKRILTDCSLENRSVCDGKYPISEGLKAVVRGNTIVTVA